jgi:hypothetical protein
MADGAGLDVDHDLAGRLVEHDLLDERGWPNCRQTAALMVGTAGPLQWAAHARTDGPGLASAKSSASPIGLAALTRFEGG